MQGLKEQELAAKRRLKPAGHSCRWMDTIILIQLRPFFRSVTKYSAKTTWMTRRNRRSNIVMLFECQRWQNSGCTEHQADDTEVKVGDVSISGSVND